MICVGREKEGKQTDEVNRTLVFVLKSVAAFLFILTIVRAAINPETSDK